jgi:peptidoglycan/LPS O-acetylase OafA/YrhL
MTNGAGSGYVPGLDGLRAVAALAVFAVHFNQATRLDIPPLGFFDIPRLLDNGNTGVALFFTLSGFLLSMPFWNALAYGDDFPSVASYAVKRLTRIVPAYYFAVTALMIVNGLWRKSDRFGDLLFHYGFIHNFSDSFFYSLNPPFWTIGIEMQFYVLLPLVFLLVWRWPPAAAMTAVALLGVAAYGAHFVIMSFAESPGPTLSHSVIAHLPHFLLGVYCGRIYLYRSKRLSEPSRGHRLRNDAVFWGSAALIVVILGTGLDGSLTLPFGRYNFPVVPVLIALILLSAPRSLVARGCLEGNILRLLGVVSYGIYLYHLPIMNVTGRMMGYAGLGVSEHWATFLAASLTLTVIAATATYVAFERPILNLARRGRRIRSVA